MGWGSVAVDRTRVENLPTDLDAVIEPAGRTTPKNGNPRDRYLWKFDAYGIVSVSVYLPIGERLPKGGIVLTGESFDPKLGTDKPRVGTKVGGYRDGTVGGDGEALSVFVEAPNNFDQFESITIRHA